MAMRTSNKVDGIAHVYRKYWIAVAAPFILVMCFFIFIYSGMRIAYIEQARKFARFTAVCAAARINPGDLDSIQKPKDATGETYARLQKTLTAFRDSSEEGVRYVWIMRRSAAPGAKPSDYEFVVDQRAAR